MATINNKLIHFKSKSDFNGRYAESTDGGKTYGDFLGTSIVFIQDAKQIWTHGQFYDANEATLASLGITATAAELNKLDGVTATTQELNCVDGVTSNIQTQLNGKAASSHNHSAANITSGTLDLARIPSITDAKITSVSASKITGTIPQANLPSYVDDVLEYSSKFSFPKTGESGKIYVDTTTNLTYRWGGSSYVEISPSLALGETSSTAFRGDRGKIAYDHSQATGNPHNLTLSNLGISATAAELNFVDGVTSNIQTQLNAKANTSALSAYAVKDGSNASGTWPISVNGTAAYATVLSSNSSTSVSNYLQYCMISGQTSLVGSNAVNGAWCLPTTGGDAGRGNGQILRFGWAQSYYTDLHTGPNEIGSNSGLQFRQVVAGAVSSLGWRTLLDTANYTSYTVTKTGGGASGTWNINISGAAASANSVAWNNISGKPSTFTPSTHTHSQYLTSASLNGYATQSWVNSQGFIKSATDTKNTTGTSNSTSKLYLAGGTSQSSTGVVTYSNSSVYTQSGKLYATQMNATNGFYETSDARLKNFNDDIKALDVVSEIPTKYFTWKSDESKTEHIGTSAQEIQKLYPDLVTENEDGVLSVDYARLSIITLAAIKELKAQIDELKSKIN